MTTLALPVGNIDVGSPTPTMVRATTFGLPVGNIDIGSPAPWIGGPSNKPLLNLHTATLFDVDGVTRLAALPNAVIGPWTVENSRTGQGTFQVPLDDATTALITQRRIVQLAWYQNGILLKNFPVLITSEGLEVAVEGRRWLRFEDQPGHLALLRDATVYPEYGWQKHSSATRTLGFMSAPGNWLRNGDWHAPAGNLLSTETTYRKNHPPQLKTVDPYWIAANNPAAAVASGVVNYFRASLTVADGTYCSLITTGDNFFTLYIDGEEVVSPDLSNPLGWRTAEPQPITLAGGTHIIAARVENGSFPQGDHSSPIGFIFALLETDNRGKPTGTVLLKSDTTNWSAHDDTPDPGWSRAQVIRALLAEAQARGTDPANYSHLNYITPAFTDFHDSSGAAFTDIGEYNYDVSKVSLLDVTDGLTEAEVDIALLPDMRLYVWKRRGRDLSATVRFLPGDQGGTLKQYSVGTAAPTATTVLAEVGDSSWVEVTDAASALAWGRIESGLSLGTASDASTARKLAKSQLGQTSIALVNVSSEASVLAGPIPFRDFDVADTIGTPAPRNRGSMKSRVLSISVDGSDTTSEKTRAWIEYAKDESV